MPRPPAKPLTQFAPQAWLLLLFGMALCRLYLTGDRDIAALNSPHDEFWYVHKAFSGLWAGPYDEMSFMHPPVYVWWLQLLKGFGVPLRLGIDLAWVASVGYLAFSFCRFSGSRLISLLLAAFLLFHPDTVFIFDRPLAETLLAVAITVCVASALQVWTLRDTDRAGSQLLAALAFSLAFAIAFHVRKEGIALLVPLCVLAAASLFWRASWWPRSARLDRSPGILLFVAPLIATLGLGLAISTLNYFKWGSFVRYELASPGYESALATLTRIDTGRTPLQVSVTRAMLEKAYAASPTLRELKPQMDGPVGQEWVNISSPFVSAKGEIGNGWFYWALRDAAAHAGWHASAPLAEQKYRAVARELRAAFANGALQQRNSFLPALVDPDFRKWLPSMPASLSNVLRITVLPLAGDVAIPRDTATPAQLKEYARVAGRRSLPPSIELNGWIVAPPGSMIGLAAGEAEPAWTPISATARPDVPGALVMQLAGQAVAGSDRIAVRTPDGKIGRVALSDLQAGKTASISGEFASTLGVDALDTGIVSKRADSRLEGLVRLSRAFGMAFAAGLGLSLLLAALTRRLDGRLVAAMACLLFLASRLGIFALLDASSWNGVQARYMLPILPVFACAGALGIAVLLAQLRNAMSPKAVAAVG